MAFLSFHCPLLEKFCLFLESSNGGWLSFLRHFLTAFSSTYAISVSASIALVNYLDLEGGTAINLTIFNLPRLSVDINLDLAENLPLDDMKDMN